DVRWPRLDRGTDGPSHLDAREHGTLEPLEETGHLLLDLAQVADVGEGAVVELGGLRHEVAVERRADADREEPRVAEPLLDDSEELRLVADAAVGQEHDLPHEA